MFDQDVEKDLFSNNEASGAAKQTIRARCPECYKLYAIRASEITEKRPKFACLECETKFWLPYPAVLESDDIIMGFPVSWTEEVKPRSQVAAEVESPPQIKTDHFEPIRQPEPEVQTPSAELSLKIFNCPKCEEPYAAEDAECAKCGIIFQKFLDRQNKSKEELNAPRPVKEAWESLITDYESYQSHQQFMGLCQKYDCIDYAFNQYDKVLEVNPNDSMALKAQNQLSCIAVTMAESTVPVQEDKGYGFPKMKIINFLYFLSAVIIAIGIFMPQLRNLVGFGSAVLFAILALRFYFRIL